MKARNVLYVLPTEQIRNRFVSTRVAKTTEYTSQYRVNKKASKSSGLREIGTGIVNYVGSNAESVFTEFVAHDVIIDELDQCNIANTYMAVERQSSIFDKTQMKVSNPTICNFGIDEEYAKSDKKVWKVKCCHCGNWIAPDFFKHIVEEIRPKEYVLRDRDYDYTMDRDIFVICNFCNKPFDRYAEGQWVKQNLYNKISGYHVSKLFSTTVKVTELVERFNEGLTNDRKMQRFYNADLGYAFTSSGAKITAAMLDDCIMDFPLLEECKDPCLIGIDVGAVLNVIIGKIVKENNIFKVALIYINELHNENDIIELFKRYNIKSGIIDSKPEIRMTRRLLVTLKPLWSIDYLTDSMKDAIDVDRKIFKTDRTMSLDGVKEAVLLQDVLLPRNIRTVDNFYEHMEASTRIWKENNRIIEGGRYVWIEGNKPDHYFHSLNYLLQAKKLLFLLK